MPKKAQQNLVTDETLFDRGLSRNQFNVLRDSVYQGASSETGVLMAYDYCVASGLDPFKRCVHVVQVWSKRLNAKVDTVWPGITAVRTTAFRTNAYAGRSPFQFGPDVTENFTFTDDNGKEVTQTIKYPEWCEVTVKRIVNDVVCEFPGPRVFWKEAYSRRSPGEICPDDYWLQHPYGQIQKSTEAATLRATFPESIGGQLIAHEMRGKEMDIAPISLPDSSAAEPSPMMPIAAEPTQQNNLQPPTKQAAPDTAQNSAAAAWAM